MISDGYFFHCDSLFHDKSLFRHGKTNIKSILKYTCADTHAQTHTHIYIYIYI